MGNNRYVDELHLKDPGHNPTSSELLMEMSVAAVGRNVDTCDTDANRDLT